MSALSAYEQVLYWYAQMHEAYGWTRAEIDAEELEYMLDLIVVRAKVAAAQNEEPSAYIDEVL